MLSRLESIVAEFGAEHGRPPTVLVDMDEVLCQWEVQFVEYHRRMFPHIPTADAGRRESFDMFAGLTGEALDATAAVMNEPGFYAHLLPVPGALEAILAMQAIGIDVALCTSPWLSNPTCASDKLSWVERHLGEPMASSTIITRDKTRVAGDILIDDNPMVRGRRDPEWTLIRFTYHYNRHLEGLRIDHWGEWTPAVATALSGRTSGSTTG